MPVANRPTPHRATDDSGQVPQLVVVIPSMLRAVLLEWSEPFDPALVQLGVNDAATMRAMLVRIASAPGTLRLSCFELLMLYRTARINQQYGLVVSLRQQGALVCAWAAAAFSASGPLAA